MRKFLAILLIAATILSLAACGKAPTQESAQEFLETLERTSIDDMDEEIQKAFEKESQSEFFDDAVRSYLASHLSYVKESESMEEKLHELGYDCNYLAEIILDYIEDYKKEINHRNMTDCVNLAERLQGTKSMDEAAVKAFREFTDLCCDAFYAENSQIPLKDYISVLSRFSEISGLGITMEDYFSYDKTKSYIEEKGKLTISKNNEGGFFDDKTDTFQDKSFWYDPLAEKRVSKGSVGTYHHLETNQLAGDFCLRHVSQEWYGGPTPDDTASVELRYRNENHANTSREGMQKFIDLAPDSKVYVWEEDKDFIIGIVNESCVGILGYGEAIFLEK